MNSCFWPVLLVVATLRKLESDPVVFVAAPTIIPLGNAGGGVCAFPLKTYLVT